jgi:hypothetical protein
MKWLKPLALPVLGAALVAIVNAFFPQYVEAINRKIHGTTFGPYTVLRANDENPKNPPVVTNLNLTEYNGLLSGELHIPADRSRHIPSEGGTRHYAGYLGGNGYLVLAYKSDWPLHGIGEYFFSETDNGTYVGHARVNICTKDGEIIKQCNAVLTKDQTQAMKLYEKSLHQQCQLVAFPAPDSAKVAEREPCPEDLQTGFYLPTRELPNKIAHVQAVVGARLSTRW